MTELEVLRAGVRGLSVTIHHSVQGWLIMPEDEKRWTVTFRRVVRVGALAASQTAAGVETRTEPPFFEPGCPHHSEILFRHTAVLFAVILQQSNRRGLCSCLASAHLLETLTLLGCYHQRQWCPSYRLPPLGLMGHRAESAGFPQRWLLSFK